MKPLQKILVVAANYYPKVTSNLVESAKNIIEGNKSKDSRYMECSTR